MPITDAQLSLLRAAALRDDGLLPRPDKLAGAALARMDASLTGAGLAEPVPVGADQPRWRKDADAAIGLRITDEGRAAIGVEEAAPSSVQGEADGPSARHPSLLRRPWALACSALPRDGQDGTDRDGGEALPTLPAAPRSFRPGSKAARLVALLSEGEGASVDALARALSWQPHTVRAALTRLRQDGYAVTTGKDARKGTVYRIAAAPESGPALADATAGGIA